MRDDLWGKYFIFIVFTIVFNIPVISYFLSPDSPYTSFMMLLWLNIGGLPISLIPGESVIEIKEFGSIPKSTAAWLAIELVWLLISSFVTWLILKIK